MTIERTEFDQAAQAVQQSAQVKDVDTIASSALHQIIQERLTGIQKEDDITVLSISDISLQQSQEDAGNTGSTDDPSAANIPCEVLIECLPTVPWENLRDKPHTQIDFQPSDAELEKTAKDELMQKAGELVDQIKVTESSFVEIKISCKVNGKVLPAYTSQKAYIDMGKKDFWPEVLTALKGGSIGKEFSATVTLDQTSSPLLRGKSAVFEGSILAIKQFHPAKKADDVAAKKVGCPSLDEFLKQFKDHAVKTGKKTAAEIEHRALVDLVSDLEFEVPKSIYSERLSHQKNLAMEAIRPRKKLSEEEDRYICESAMREAKLVTFVLAYAKAQDISVSSKDVRAVYTPKTPEENEFYEGIVLEGKVFDSLKKLLKVDIKKMSLKQLQEKIHKKN